MAAAAGFPRTACKRHSRGGRMSSSWNGSTGCHQQLTFGDHFVVRYAQLLDEILIDERKRHFSFSFSYGLPGHAHYQRSN